MERTALCETYILGTIFELCQFMRATSEIKPPGNLSFAMQESASDKSHCHVHNPQYNAQDRMIRFECAQAVPNRACSSHCWSASGLEKGSLHQCCCWLRRPDVEARCYLVAPGSLGENEKHVFLMLPRRARARLYVQSAEEFIVVPVVIVANAAEMRDGRWATLK
jgi:hypothetical protein